MKRVMVVIGALALLGAGVGVVWAVRETAPTRSAVQMVWSEHVATRSLLLPEEADDWELVIHYELREGGGGRVAGFQSVVSDCRPGLAQGVGECGAPAAVEWDLEGLPAGWYEVVVRPIWSNGHEVVYCLLEGADSQAGDWWYMIDKVEVGHTIYLPLLFKVVDE